MKRYDLLLICLLFLLFMASCSQPDVQSGKYYLDNDHDTYIHIINENDIEFHRIDVTAYIEGLSFADEKGNYETSVKQIEAAFKQTMKYTKEIDGNRMKLFLTVLPDRGAYMFYNSSKGELVLNDSVYRLNEKTG